MNYNDNGDELERMRARNRRGAKKGTLGPKPVQGRQSPRARSGSQGIRGRGHYDEEYSYDEEFSQEEYGRGGLVQNVHGQGNRAQDEDDVDWEDDIYMDEDFLMDDGPGYRQEGRRAAPRLRASRSNKAGNNGKRQDASGRRGQGQMAKKRKRKGFKWIILLLLAGFLGYGAWLFLHRPTGIWNIAVFGVDSRDGNTKRALADVQMICSIDRSTGEIRLVSVYRDTYLKINSEGTFHKINEAYFQGGQEQAVAALEENLDLKIDDYAAFNWKSVAEAINILGGIDLDITPAEFKYINSFITETVESTGIASVHLAQAGPNHLDGVQAVAYSRLRLMDTDFQRTERQRKVVTLALEKAKQANASTLTSLAAYMVPQISTSVGVDDVLPLVKDIKKYHIGETAGFPFSRQTARVGKMDCVIPTTLESNVALLHQFLYGEDAAYRPSSAVKKISARISEETGLYEEGKAAPSSQGSSGGSAGNTFGGDKAPAQTAPPETQQETAAEETIQETVEESTGAAPEETAGSDETAGTEETEETEEIGPGVSTKPSNGSEAAKEEAGPPEGGGPGGDSAKPSDKPSQVPEEETAPQPSKAPEPGPSPGSVPGSGQDGNPLDQGEAGPGV